MKKPKLLPNMHNLGVNLRILVIVNLVLALAAMLLSNHLSEFLSVITAISAIAQPMLLLSLLLLYLSYPMLVKLPYWQGIAGLIFIVLLTCYSVLTLLAEILIFNDLPSMMRVLFFVFCITAITLYYFYLHQRAYSPAIDEARLQALQARIRPHFLFNCINAVLSLIRSQPKQAETALEDMADLFRVLMADNRDLVPLSQEVALCRQYLALEQLRLNERLHVDWQLEEMTPNALVPPLLLQPLIENAVYHGIEPLAKGGAIIIQIYTKRNEVHLILTNPYHTTNTPHIGNKMALNNIKERLNLHFDLEASLKSTQTNGEYQVHIVFPLTTQ